MGAFSDYLETKLLDYTLRGTGYTAPTSVWVGLCTGACSSDSTAAEADAGTYARKQITFDAASTSSIKSNSATITFDPATGTSWGVISGYGIYDASSSGNLMYYSTLSTPVTCNVGDTLEFAGSAITVTLD